jgi:hypothetical protein
MPRGHRLTGFVGARRQGRDEARATLRSHEEGTAMIERQVNFPPENPPESPPGVNIQDVEHDARPETRVDNAGVKVKPPAKKPDEPDTDPEGEHEKRDAGPH